MKSIRLTHQLIMGARTPRGGFNGKQLSALGIDLKRNAGWVRDLVGQSVPLQVWEAFVAAGRLGKPKKMESPQLFEEPVYTPSERGKITRVGNGFLEEY